MRKIAIGCFATLILTGCAGRAPQIEPVVLASDRQLDCQEIEGETRINNDKIAALAQEQNWKVGQNVVAGVVGFMAWPAWLGLDLQDAAGKETKALNDRNTYLLNLASDRCHGATRTRETTASLPFKHEAPSPLASNAEIASSLISR